MNFYWKKRWTKKYLKNPIVIIIAFIFLLALTAYFFFIQGRISDKSQDWGGFGSYVQGLFSGLNFVIFTVLTMLIYENSKTEEVHRRQDERRFQKPVVSFFRYATPEYYYLKNLGKGGAFNLRIKINYDSTVKKWESSYIYHHIGSDSTDIPMDYTENCKNICAIYEDLFQHTYYSYMVNDKLTIVDTYADESNLPLQTSIKEKCVMESIKEAVYVTKPFTPRF